LRRYKHVMLGLRRNDLRGILEVVLLRMLAESLHFLVRIVRLKGLGIKRLLLLHGINVLVIMRVTVLVIVILLALVVSLELLIAVLLDGSKLFQRRGLSEFVDFMA